MPISSTLWSKAIFFWLVYWFWAKLTLNLSLRRNAEYFGTAGLQQRE